MTDSDTREPLIEFLGRTELRTGDSLESAALAEMDGYTAADARDAGWDDIFAAARSVTPAPTTRAHLPLPAIAEGWRAAFARGVSYTAPVIAIWSLLPMPATPADLVFLSLTVIAAWGGSLGVTYSVAARLESNPRGAWAMAAVACAIAATCAAVISFLLVRSGTVPAYVGLVAVLACVYFFAASPLTLLVARYRLLAVAILGAACGAVSLAVPSSPLDTALRVAAAASMLLPLAVLLHRLVTAAPGSGPRSAVSKTNLVAFVVYGSSFAALVLWAPLVSPEAPISLLSLLLVAFLSLAEVAVANAKRHGMQMLLQPFNHRDFIRQSRQFVVTGMATYLLPVIGAIGVACAVLTLRGESPLLVAISGLAVVALGALQITCLICVALNGIRSLALPFAVTALALTVAATTSTTDVARAVIYLLLVSGLAAVAFLLALVHTRRPINFL